jgi:hypothetical protein
MLRFIWQQKKENIAGWEWAKHELIVEVAEKGKTDHKKISS